MFLIGGALLGLIWANVDAHSYHSVAHVIHFGINDVAMALFFLIAGKEIREAMLPGGPLANPKTAALPLMATIGGMAGPALVYLAGVHYFNTPELGRGWAIPMATDIAFSYLIARLIFPRIGGKTHPAIVFLLLLAIADDAGGLIVLAVFYPQGDMSMLWLFGGTAIALGASLGFWKVLKWTSFWPYLLGPGVLLWFAFYKGGIHPALALVPLCWFMPHTHSDMGLWDPGESEGKDTLNKMEHWWKNPVEIILGFFGFVNAGVELSALATGTWLVFAGLLIGKPVGIFLMTKLGQLGGLELPEGMGNKELIVVGFAAGIGFTVALFISVVAFPAGELQDSVKMGALFSFALVPITWIAAKMMGVGKKVEQE
ncbi:Na+/H+ antiporter NhaA [Myxococcota bacterium]|nr:Na+/H+ antiporter NhaA [Myxococcota bacterium]